MFIYFKNTATGVWKLVIGNYPLLCLIFIDNTNPQSDGMQIPQVLAVTRQGV
jgi:hypothetical protein